MRNIRIISSIIIAGVVILSLIFVNRNTKNIPENKVAGIEIPDVSKQPELATLSESEWQQRLTPNQFKVMRQAGTEVPFTSPLLNEKRAGTYITADCGEPVFRSEQKFETGTGWPSFYAPIKVGAVVEQLDPDGERTEILSPICKTHLGHVFDDAPKTPTGLRYCINGLALIFIPDTVQ